jgi:hypothetical protein
LLPRKETAVSVASQLKPINAICRQNAVFPNAKTVVYQVSTALRGIKPEVHLDEGFGSISSTVKIEGRYSHVVKQRPEGNENCTYEGKLKRRKLVVWFRLFYPPIFYIKRH